MKTALNSQRNLALYRSFHRAGTVNNCSFYYAPHGVSKPMLWKPCPGVLQLIHKLSAAVGHFLVATDFAADLVEDAVDVEFGTCLNHRAELALHVPPLQDLTYTALNRSRPLTPEMVNEPGCGVVEEISRRLIHPPKSRAMS